jgi:hypothetical protein
MGQTKPTPAQQERRLLRAALQEQQVAIETQGAAIARIAKLAGIDLSDLAKSNGQRVAAIRRQADAENPAQPIPEPAAEAPAATTAETLGDLNDDDVTAPGATSVTDVSPDATTNLADTGTVLDEPLDLNEQDPTKPVAGTTDMRPLNETKIETEVRAGQGDNSSTMFPLQGPFAQQATTGSARAFAALRLARYRIAAGIEQGDDLALGESIASDPAVTDAAIASEIETLGKVVQARRTQQARPAHLVPQGQRQASRSMPSVGVQAPPMEVLAAAAGSISDDEVMFEG